MTDIQEIRRQLLGVAGFSELYLVATFKGYREDNSGVSHLITVEIWDGGPEVPDRYVVTAENDSGRIAVGESGDSITAAIKGVAWHRLDEPAD